MGDSPQEQGKNVLSVKNLSIGFGGLKAVDGLSFDIKKKEIFGLIGPNGAGKTTAFNCITQFYTPDEGKIVFTDKQGIDHHLTDHKVHEIIGLGVVRTFQNVELIHELSIIDNVLIGAHVDMKSSLFSQGLKLRKAVQEEKFFKEKAMEILRALGIEEKANELVAGQPYGMMKKVELARTLISRPHLIILDEPAAGLNDAETIELAQLIKEIRDKLGCSILLIEHDMRLVMNICDRICALSFGKPLALGTPVEIKTNKKVQEAYLGLDGDLS